MGINILGITYYSIYGLISEATKSALPGWELKYANETFLFRLQLFQCNVKIHLIRSIPLADDGCNTAIESFQTDRLLRLFHSCYFHYSESIPEYKRNTKNSSINIDIPAC